MNADQAFEIVKAMLHRIAPEVDVMELDPDTELQAGLDLDSMDFLNLVAGIHDRTGVDIPEADYPKLLTLGSFASYLAGRAA